MPNIFASKVQSVSIFNQISMCVNLRPISEMYVLLYFTPKTAFNRDHLLI